MVGGPGRWVHGWEGGAPRAKQCCPSERPEPRGQGAGPAQPGPSHRKACKEVRVRPGAGQGALTPSSSPPAPASASPPAAAPPPPPRSRSRSSPPLRAGGQGCSVPSLPSSMFRVHLCPKVQAGPFSFDIYVSQRSRPARPAAARRPARSRALVQGRTPASPKARQPAASSCPSSRTSQGSCSGPYGPYPRCEVHGIQFIYPDLFQKMDPPAGGVERPVVPHVPGDMFRAKRPKPQV